MALYRYVSNRNVNDGVGAIRLAPDENQERLLVRGGEPMDLTESEYAALCGPYELVAVETDTTDLAESGTSEESEDESGDESDETEAPESDKSDEQDEPVGLEVTMDSTATSVTAATQGVSSPLYVSTSTPADGQLGGEN